MLSDPYTKMMFELMEMRRMTSNADRVGHVHEVKKDKIRCVMGIRPDGTEWLSPWLHCEDHRGFSSDNTGHTQRQVYTKGQTVKISLQGNDHRAATVSPYAESTSQPPPAHADDYLDDKQAPTAETYHNGKLRMAAGHVGNDKKKAKFYDIWIADDADLPPAHQDQTGQAQSGGASQQPQQQQKSKAKPVMKLRVSESGFITGRVGTDIRFAAHSAGAKVKAGDTYVVATKTVCNVNSAGPVNVKAKGNANVTASGQVIVNSGGVPLVSQAWQLGGKAADVSDPVPDDNT